MTDDTKAAKTRRRKPKGPFSEELLDQLLAQVRGRDAESLLGESGLVGQLKKQLAERMLSAELNHHLANERASGEEPGNHRNGSSAKSVLTPSGPLPLEIPRDRHASFDPVLVAKHQRRLPGYDDHVIGMTMREIRGHLLELYGLEVPPGLISTITDEVLTEVTEWQARPLDTMYPIVYFDALRLKIRGEGTVKNKAVYLALGVDAAGHKDVPAIRTSSTPRFFRSLNTLSQVDGLKGFPEAIEATFPQAQIQTRIVHLIRNSLSYVAWKDRKALAAELKPVYQAANAEAAEAALAAFEEGPRDPASARRSRRPGAGNGRR